MDPDLLLACYLASRYAWQPDAGPRYGGGDRLHLRRHCPGPILVKLDEPHTGPISELTPDPKTYVTATVQCPHMPDAKFVSWNEFGRLPEMLATLIQHEAGLERDWAPRVTTYQ